MAKQKAKLYFFATHRDVKPSNILINFKGEEEEMKTISVCHITAKLCDFGLARVYNSLASQTISYTAAGTVSYAAPEIRRMLEMERVATAEELPQEDTITTKYTESCDIFSAGVVTHEMLTGKLEKGNNCLLFFHNLSHINCTELLAWL